MSEKYRKASQKVSPTEWWSMYGRIVCPNLAPIAIRILSQTVTASNCERNWTTFSLIHTKTRNRLKIERLENLVFCHYNMRLRKRRLQREENNEQLIDLDKIFHDEDPLQPWITETEPPVLDGGDDSWMNEDTDDFGGSGNDDDGGDGRNDDIPDNTYVRDDDDYNPYDQSREYGARGNVSQTPNFRRSQSERGDFGGGSRQAAYFGTGYGETETSTNSNTDIYNSYYDSQQQQEDLSSVDSVVDSFFGTTDYRNFYPHSYNYDDDEITEPARHSFWQ